MDAAYKRVNGDHGHEEPDTGRRRRGSMYLEEETSKKSEVISCIFSLKGGGRGFGQGPAAL
ncbi:uncharacterized protein ACO6RY_14632 [Pungitius sinensis]